MKKKGFTLVELLAVIALLGILATLAVTSAINVSVGIRNDMYCEKLEFIENNAKQYGLDHYRNDLNETFTVKELVDLGYIKIDQDVEGARVIDPRDNSSMEEVKVNIYVKNRRAYAHVNVDASVCEEK